MHEVIPALAMPDTPPWPRGKFLACVDRRPESKIALTLACLKAARRGGVLEIMHVMEPESEIQTLFSVSDLVREERRQEGEALMQQLAEHCQKVAGVIPTLSLKEGRVGETILAAVQEDPDVTMLVLGAQPSAKGRGQLLAWLASQLGDRLLVPLMLVPGNLTDQQIDMLI